MILTYALLHASQEAQYFNPVESFTVLKESQR